MESDCRDVSQITDEDLLRRMWQQTEDFGRKKEIRSHMYKLREARLKEFYTSGEVLRDVQRSNSSPGLREEHKKAQWKTEPTHADSLVDHSFLSLKSKEIRDSESPTRDVSYQISGNRDTGNYTIITTEKSNDGKFRSSSKVNRNQGSQAIDGGVINFKSINESKSATYNDGDDKNYTKAKAESQRHASHEVSNIGDTNIVTQTKTSSSVRSSSSQMSKEFDSGNKLIGETKMITCDIPPEYLGKGTVTKETKVLDDGSTVTTIRYQSTGGNETRSSFVTEQRSSTSDNYKTSKYGSETISTTDNLKNIQDTTGNINVEIRKDVSNTSRDETDHVTRKTIRETNVEVGDKQKTKVVKEEYYIPASDYTVPKTNVTVNETVITEIKCEKPEKRKETPQYEKPDRRKEDYVYKKSTATEGQYSTTYRDEYTNKRISVETGNPTHDAFARSLRAVSPDRDDSRTSSRRSSSSQLRRSPEKQRNDKPSRVSPERKSPDRKSPERKTYRTYEFTVDVTSKEGSPERRPNRASPERRTPKKYGVNVSTHVDVSKTREDTHERIISRKSPVRTTKTEDFINIERYETIKQRQNQPKSRTPSPIKDSPKRTPETDKARTPSPSKYDRTTYETDETRTDKLSSLTSTTVSRQAYVDSIRRTSTRETSPPKELPLPKEFDSSTITRKPKGDSPRVSPTKETTTTIESFESSTIKTRKPKGEPRESPVKETTSPTRSTKITDTVFIRNKPKSDSPRETSPVKETPTKITETIDTVVTKPKYDSPRDTSPLKETKTTKITETVFTRTKPKCDIPRETSPVKETPTKPTETVDTVVTKLKYDTSPLKETTTRITETVDTVFTRNKPKYDSPRETSPAKEPTKTTKVTETVFDSSTITRTKKPKHDSPKESPDKDIKTEFDSSTITRTKKPKPDSPKESPDRDNKTEFNSNTITRSKTTRTTDSPRDDTPRKNDFDSSTITRKSKPKPKESPEKELIGEITVTLTKTITKNDEKPEDLRPESDYSTPRDQKPVDNIRNTQHMTQDFTTRETRVDTTEQESFITVRNKKKHRKSPEKSLRTDDFINIERVEVVKQRQSPEKPTKLQIDNYPQTFDDRSTRDSSPTSNASDIEFIPANNKHLITDLDAESDTDITKDVKRSDIEETTRTVEEDIKQTIKNFDSVIQVIDDDMSKKDKPKRKSLPLDKDDKKPKEKPAFRRSETYKERCAMILGMTDTVEDKPKETEPEEPKSKPYKAEFEVPVSKPEPQPTETPEKKKPKSRDSPDRKIKQPKETKPEVKEDKPSEEPKFKPSAPPAEPICKFEPTPKPEKVQQPTSQETKPREEPTTKEPKRKSPVKTIPVEPKDIKKEPENVEKPAPLDKTPGKLVELPEDKPKEKSKPKPEPKEEVTKAPKETDFDSSSLRRKTKAKPKDSEKERPVSGETTVIKTLKTDFIDEKTQFKPEPKEEFKFAPEPKRPAKVTCDFIDIERIEVTKQQERPEPKGDLPKEPETLPARSTKITETIDTVLIKSGDSPRETPKAKEPKAKFEPEEKPMPKMAPQEVPKQELKPKSPKKDDKPEPTPELIQEIIPKEPKGKKVEPKEPKPKLQEPKQVEPIEPKYQKAPKDIQPVSQVIEPKEKPKSEFTEETEIIKTKYDDLYAGMEPVEEPMITKKHIVPLGPSGDDEPEIIIKETPKLNKKPSKTKITDDKKIVYEKTIRSRDVPAEQTPRKITKKVPEKEPDTVETEEFEDIVITIDVNKKPEIKMEIYEDEQFTGIVEEKTFQEKTKMFETKTPQRTETKKVHKTTVIADIVEPQYKKPIKKPIKTEDFISTEQNQEIINRRTQMVEIKPTKQSPRQPTDRTESPKDIRKTDKKLPKETNRIPIKEVPRKKEKTPDEIHKVTLKKRVSDVTVTEKYEDFEVCRVDVKHTPITNVDNLEEKELRITEINIEDDDQPSDQFPRMKKIDISIEEKKPTKVTKQVTTKTVTMKRDDKLKDIKPKRVITKTPEVKTTKRVEKVVYIDNIAKRSPAREIPKRAPVTNGYPREDKPTKQIPEKKIMPKTPPKTFRKQEIPIKETEPVKKHVVTKTISLTKAKTPEIVRPKETKLPTKTDKTKVTTVTTKTTKTFKTTDREVRKSPERLIRPVEKEKTPQPQIVTVIEETVTRTIPTIITTKSIDMDTITTEENTVVDFLRSKSSRDSSPEKIWPIPVSEDETEYPRYPDQIYEPDDTPRTKPKKIQHVPLNEDEVISEFDKITEINLDESELSVNEKVTRFMNTAEETRRQKSKSPAPKISRPEFQVTEELKEDECLLSVSEKVSKFLISAEKSKETIKDQETVTEEYFPKISDKVSKFLTTEKVTVTSETSKPQEIFREPKSVPQKPDESPRRKEKSPSPEYKPKQSPKEPKYVPQETEETSKRKEKSPSPEYRSPPKPDETIFIRKEKSPERKPDSKSPTKTPEKTESPKSEKKLPKNESPKADAPLSKKTITLKSSEAVRKAKDMFENVAQAQTPRQRDILSRPSVWEGRRLAQKPKEPEPKEAKPEEKSVKLTDLDVNKTKDTGKILNKTDSTDFLLKSTRLLIKEQRESADVKVDNCTDRIIKPDVAKTPVKQVSPERSTSPTKYSPRYTEVPTTQEPEKRISPERTTSPSREVPSYMKPTHTFSKSCSHEPENIPRSQSPEKDSPKESPKHPKSSKPEKIHIPSKFISKSPEKEPPTYMKPKTTPEKINIPSKFRGSPERDTYIKPLTKAIPQETEVITRRHKSPEKDVPGYMKPKEVTKTTQITETVNKYRSKSPEKETKTELRRDSTYKQNIKTETIERINTNNKFRGKSPEKEMVNNFINIEKNIEIHQSIPGYMRPLAKHEEPKTHHREDVRKISEKEIRTVRDYVKEEPETRTRIITKEPESYIRQKSLSPDRKVITETTVVTKKEKTVPGYMKPLQKQKSETEEVEEDADAPRAGKKFGVTLRRTDSGRTVIVNSTTTTVTERRRSSTASTGAQLAIDDIQDLDLLEDMMEKAVGYEQRRKIRAQIRNVRRLITENKITYTPDKKVPSKQSSSKKEHVIVKKQLSKQFKDEPIEDEIKTIDTKQNGVFSTVEITQNGHRGTVTQSQKINGCHVDYSEEISAEKKVTKRTERIQETIKMVTGDSKNLTFRKTTPSAKKYDYPRSQPQIESREESSKTTDVITSSYGIGPTDENGLPLFGIRALRKAGGDNVHVTGSVVSSQFYSETGKEPVGQVSVTKYSSDPRDLGLDYETNKPKGCVSVTTTQKFGSTGTPSFREIADSKSTTELKTKEDDKKTITKVTRRGSVKALSQKFIENAVETVKSERQSYPKAGLILRTGSFSDSHESTNVIEQETVQEYYESGDSEDRQSSLTKYLGSKGLISGIEEAADSPASASLVLRAQKITTKETGKPTIITKRFEGPVTYQSKELLDEQTLRLLLEQCTDYEERRIIREKLKQVMADQEACANVVSRTVSSEQETEDDKTSVQERVETTEKTIVKGPHEKIKVSTTTQVTTQVKSNKPMSPFAKFRQLDKQNSLNTPPSSPRTPGGGPLFKFTDPALSQSASTVKDRLLQWCQMKTKEYQNIKLVNFSTCWADGLAFCALIHHFLPDAFDYHALTPQQRRHNFTLAFKVADEQAGIAPLLDVDDMVAMRRPDWKCVFTYVQSIYRRFKDED